MDRLGDDEKDDRTGPDRAKRFLVVQVNIEPTATTRHYAVAIVKVLSARRRRHETCIPTPTLVFLLSKPQRAAIPRPRQTPLSIPSSSAEAPVYRERLRSHPNGRIFAVETPPAGAVAFDLASMLPEGISTQTEHANMTLRRPRMAPPLCFAAHSTLGIEESGSQRTPRSPVCLGTLKIEIDNPKTKPQFARDIYVGRYSLLLHLVFFFFLFSSCHLLRAAHTRPRRCDDRSFSPPTPPLQQPQHQN